MYRLKYQTSRSSNVLAFHISGSISSRPESFLFLIFVRTTISPFWVNCNRLTSCWFLIIFVIDLSVSLGEFPIRFLKCSFHMCIRSSCLTAFSFVLEVFLLFLTWFTVNCTLCDCLSSTAFLIWLFWHWIYSICSFWYVLISSPCVFLRLCAFALIWYPLLHSDVVFTLFRFFLLTSHRPPMNLCFALGLIGMNSLTASMWTLTKFSYS